MSNFKKLLSCILAVFLLASFSACNNEKDNIKANSTENDSSSVVSNIIIMTSGY